MFPEETRAVVNAGLFREKYFEKSKIFTPDYYSRSGSPYFPYKTF